MNTRSLLVILVAWVAALGQGQPLEHEPAKARSTVYITNFVSHDSTTSGEVVSRITQQFETAFISSKLYTVVDRQQFYRILQEANNERYARMNDIQPEKRNKLASTRAAEGVVFGEVLDDSKSGEFIISARLEDFESVVHWQQDTRIKRGLINDDASRNQAINTLLSKIAATVVSAQVTSSVALSEVTRGPALPAPRDCKSELWPLTSAKEGVSYRNRESCWIEADRANGSHGHDLDGSSSNHSFQCASGFVVWSFSSFNMYKLQVYTNREVRGINVPVRTVRREGAFSWIEPREKVDAGEYAIRFGSGSVYDFHCE